MFTTVLIDSHTPLDFPASQSCSFSSSASGESALKTSGNGVSSVLNID